VYRTYKGGNYFYRPLFRELNILGDDNKYIFERVDQKKLKAVICQDSQQALDLLKIASTVRFLSNKIIHNEFPSNILDINFEDLKTYFNLVKAYYPGVSNNEILFTEYTKLTTLLNNY
jgi:hypothetical protein